MGIPGMCPWCAHRFLQKLQENTPGLLLLDSPVSICRKMPVAAPQIDSLTHSWKHTAQDTMPRGRVELSDTGVCAGI